MQAKFNIQVYEEEWCKEHRKLQKKRYREKTEIEFDENGPVRKKHDKYKHTMNILKLGEHVMTMTYNGKQQWITSRKQVALNCDRLKQRKKTSESAIRDRLNILEAAGLIEVNRWRYGIIIKVVDRKKMEAWISEKKAEYHKLAPINEFTWSRDKFRRTGGQIPSDAIDTVSTVKIPPGDLDEDLRDKVAKAVIKQHPVMSQQSSQARKHALTFILFQLSKAIQGSGSIRSPYAIARKCLNDYVVKHQNHGLDGLPDKNHPKYGYRQTIPREIDLMVMNIARSQKQLGEYA